MDCGVLLVEIFSCYFVKVHLDVCHEYSGPRKGLKKFGWWGRVLLQYEEREGATSGAMYDTCPIRLSKSPRQSEIVSMELDACSKLPEIRVLDASRLHPKSRVCNSRSQAPPLK
jgi:hypothetical protein